MATHRPGANTCSRSVALFFLATAVACGGAEGGEQDADAACSTDAAAFDGTWQVGQSDGTTYYRHDHAEPAGLIIALHGTNGSAESVATVKREWQSFHAAADARGYSILVPESDLRDAPRRWDNSVGPGNPDTARIATLIDEAVSEGAISADDPIFVIGMSQGGGVAPIFGQVLVERGFPVRGVAAYAASPNAVCERPEYNLPTTFVAMEADDVVPEAASGIDSCADSLAARGVPAETWVKPIESLCARRFTRIPSIDATESERIFGGLVEAGVVSESGEVLVYGSDLDGESTIPGVPSEFADITREIDEQLQVVAAGHAFVGDRNEATLDFFAAQQ